MDEVALPKLQKSAAEYQKSLKAFHQDESWWYWYGRQISDC
ncbi:hypothetical protein O9992_24245 [Vibrio lentus]|nr:hypothetical protein [Vibrio lentus]